MKILRFVEFIAGFAMAVVTLLAVPAATAQTILSNEALVTTTLVVNKQVTTAKCRKAGCVARAPWFGPITVTCPAATGQSCTFSISLDAKTSTVLGCGNCGGAGATGFYTFLIDGAAPTIGPTEENGEYLFETYSYTGGLPQIASRQSYSASVLAGVTNTSSNTHTVSLGLGCRDVGKLGGCQTTAFWTTMRVEVYEP
jgi:hypothetical protein